MQLVIGLFIGAIVGYGTACLMVAAGRADKEIIKEELEDWN